MDTIIYLTLEDIKSSSNQFAIKVFDSVMKDSNVIRKCKDGVEFIRENKKLIMDHVLSMCNTLPDGCTDLFNRYYTRSGITYYLQCDNTQEAFTIPVITDIGLLYDYGKKTMPPAQ